MALTVIHSPTKYDFSRNFNYVEIASDNLTYQENRGDKSVFYFTGLFNAVINNTLTIQIGVNSYVYTFKAATNIASKEIEVPDGVMSPEEYITQLSNVLFTDPDLSTINLIPSESTLFLEAKLPGTAYNLIFCNTNVSGVNTYTTPGTTNMVTLLRPNYKIIVELQYHDGSNWKTIVTVGNPPANNKVRMDLQGYIDDYLEYDLPDFYNDAPASCERCIKRFRVKVSEAYGVPPVEVATTLSGMGTTTLDGYKHVSAPYHVLKAGFDTLSGRIKPDTQFDYYNNYQAFLTRQPRTKKIFRSQKEWLYFMFHTAPASTACLRYTFYDKNGTATVVDNYTSDPGIQIHDVWRWQVHDTQLRDNPQYMWFTVFVRDMTTGNALSETFTYYRDEKIYIEDTYLYFMNSDAGCDTVRCVGKRQSKINVIERVVAERTLLVTDTNYDGDVLQISATKNNSYVLNSGYKTQQELDYIEELIMSNKVFMYTNRYNQAIVIPLQIVNKDLVQHETNENLKKYVLEYREAVNSPVSQAAYWPIV